MIIDKHEIAAAVEKVPRRNHAFPGFIPSAFMVLLYDKDNATHVAYIRRTRGAILHSGHMAFPGGKIDKEDASSYDAAVRETFEEIGVARETYNYIGEMGYFETLTSQHDAAAHVAWSPTVPAFRKDDFEVEAIVEIPLAVLYSQFRHDLDWHDQHQVMYLNFQYQHDKAGPVVNLWGLTARITHSFLQGLRDVRGAL